MSYLAIFIGGGFGSLLRFALSQYNQFGWTVVPIGTMAANCLSCIVLGFVTGLLIAKPALQTAIKPLIAIGFCGGFSTFSTFSLETFRLLEQGQIGNALTHVVGSLVICLVALSIGFYLHRLFDLG